MTRSSTPTSPHSVTCSSTPIPTSSTSFGRADVRVASRIRRAFDGPVIAPGGSATCRTETVAGNSVVFADSIELLENRASADVPPDADYVVCEDLAPTTDRVALEVELEGLRTIADYQRESATETVFCTGSFPASYDHVWGRELEEDRFGFRSADSVRSVDPEQPNSPVSASAQTGRSQSRPFLRTGSGWVRSPASARRPQNGFEIEGTTRGERSPTRRSPTCVRSAASVSRRRARYSEALVRSSSPAWFVEPTIRCPRRVRSAVRRRRD